MIDEKKLIKRLWKRHREVQNNDDDYSNEEAEIICAEICNIVSIIDEQPKTDWIPCEERLPLPKGNEEMVEVDVTVEGNGKNVRVPAFYFFKTCNFHVYGIGGSRIKNVIAWMPKPQPYKKEGAE